MSDDAQLIEQTLAGQSEAYGELVMKYQDRLYNTVFHVVGHAEDARDIVQEAMVQAFIKLETFRRQSAFFTWLYRIAFNAAVSRRRRRRPTASLERARENADWEPSEENGDPAQSMERKERCRQVRNAIARLPEEYRVVIVLREIEGCRYETIAEVLDLPVGTVRSRLHRGRLQLKEQLSAMLTAETSD
ncbi:MAG: sigma-70 family RNA polymerase sigma factor [Pirellulales bacterium]|nr:sigma-70 family RNA polymerase sigma factor [Pirellulales bacterium]